MLQRYNEREKSLTRRFLLILGFVTFICFLTLGLAVIFWDRFPLDLTKTKKILFGGLIVIYSIIRFARILKKQPDEK